MCVAHALPCYPTLRGKCGAGRESSSHYILPNENRLVVGVVGEVLLEALVGDRAPMPIIGEKVVETIFKDAGIDLATGDVDAEEFVDLFHGYLKTLMAPA